MSDQLSPIKRRFSAKIVVDAHTEDGVIRMLEDCVREAHKQFERLQRPSPEFMEEGSAIRRASVGGDTEQGSHVVHAAFNPDMTPQAFQNAILGWIREQDAVDPDAPKSVRPLDGKEFPIATAESFAARADTTFEETETLGEMEDDE